MSASNTDSETPSTDTRQRIIDVAAHMFFEKGYVRSTTRHIAAKANVSEVTLFRHFGNKLSLFETVLDTHSGVPAARRLFDEGLSGHFVDDLQIVAQHIITSVVAENDALHLLLIDAAKDPELQGSMKRLSQQRRDLFEAYFRGLSESGAIRSSLEVETVAQAFFGMCFNVGLSALWASRRGEPVPADVMESRIKQVIDIFVNGAK